MARQMNKDNKDLEGEESKTDRGKLTKNDKQG